MPGPHVYTASSAYPYPYQQAPYAAYHTTPQHSPFIPPVDLAHYPPSPYRSNSPLPNADLAPNTVQFPGSYDPAGYPAQYPTRPRAPSYHGPTVSPFVPPVATLPSQASPWTRPLRLSNPMYPGVVPGVTLPVSPFSRGSPLPGMYPDLPGSFAIHPFLNGEVPRPDFAFNLIPQQFAPMQIMQGQPMPLGLEILQQPATHPPIYRLRIVSDDLPEWPISLEYDPESYREQTGAMLVYPPPISLGDVLAQIHRALHDRISHIDWARLDTKKKGKVTQAFTVRCANSPTMEQLVRNDGVKKVDYLLDKTWFRGLIRTENPEVLKLVVSRRWF
ncbi:hypothetical protein APHAL10511_005328 [Amanita phalloides]|nr:hypothetical protein APHAL10511_005328 [Amanita phalloides]